MKMSTKEAAASHYGKRDREEDAQQRSCRAQNLCELNEENKPRCAHHDKETGYGTPVHFVSHGFTN